MGDEDAALVAAETLGHDMVQGILDVVRQMPGWDQLAQNQQDVHIQRIDHRVRRLVSDALGILFKGDYPACVAEIATVAFGKSIKAKLEIAKTATARHELADAAGSRVVVVMANPDDFFERMGDIKGAADQRDLFHDPAEPLGHMGKESPPTPPDGAGGGEFFDGGDHGLSDKLEGGEPETVTIPEELTDSQVLELLERLGVMFKDHASAAIQGLTEKERVDAYLWGLAAEKFRAEGKQDPPLPEFLQYHTTMGSLPDPPPPLDENEQMRVDLEARRIVVTSKAVKRWSKSQRIAARAWLDGKASERPDFLPAPGGEDRP